MRFVMSMMFLLLGVVVTSLTESALVLERTQAPAVPPAPVADAPPAQASARRISVVGCVQPQARISGGDAFMLSNAAVTVPGSEIAGTVGNDAVAAPVGPSGSLVPVPSAAATGAVGPGVSTPVRTATSNYRLSGMQAAQMAAYVGTRVEVVGVLKGRGSPTGASPGGSVPGGGSGGSSTGAGASAGGSSSGGVREGVPGGTTGGSSTGSTGGSPAGGPDGLSGSSISGDPEPELEIVTVRAATGQCPVR